MNHLKNRTHIYNIACYFFGKWATRICSFGILVLAFAFQALFIQAYAAPGDEPWSDAFGDPDIMGADDMAVFATFRNELYVGGGRSA